MRKFSSYAMITLKGIGMGAADVIPGRLHQIHQYTGIQAAFHRQARTVLETHQRKLPDIPYSRNRYQFLFPGKTDAVPDGQRAHSTVVLFLRSH